MSSPFQGTPSLKSLAELLTSSDSSKKPKRIIIAAGAGISTSAGIPDFRSPKTGLYSNLQKYQLPFPEAVFEIGYFLKKPEAFFSLSKELAPGKYKPTPTHVFFRLLHEKKVLSKVFTQNIDTLERLSGLPSSSIVEAHGSFATSRCVSCKKEVDYDWIMGKLRNGEIARCQREECRGRSQEDGKNKEKSLVKPDIVFFGESLPSVFFSSLSSLSSCDLLLVFGTSLQVHPFASIVNRVPSSCPRALFNLEKVGELADFSGGGGMFARMNEEGFDFDGATVGGKEKARDLFVEGKCDENVIELVKLCGWEDEFNALTKGIHSEVERSWAEATKDLTSTTLTSTSTAKPEETSEKAAEEVSKSILKDEKGVAKDEEKEKGDDLVEKLGNLEVKDKDKDDAGKL